MHIKRLFVVVLTASIVAAGLLLGAPAQGAAPATASAASAGIAWGPCSDPGLVEAHAQCGELRVPLDYNRPGGAKITLAVSRVLHTSSDADYQGVMLVNPGAPAAPGWGWRCSGSSCPTTPTPPTTGSPSTRAASAPARRRSAASPTTSATTAPTTCR